MSRRLVGSPDMKYRSLVLFCLVVLLPQVPRVAEAARHGRAADDSTELPTAALERRHAYVRGTSVWGMHWRAPLVRYGLYRDIQASFGTPTIVPSQNRIVVGTGAGDVIAFAIDSGEEVWRVHHRAPFETGVATIEALPGQVMAVLGARDGVLLAVDVRDGREKWRTTIDTDVRAAPVQSGDQLFVAGATNKILALRVSNGEVLWTQQRPMGSGLSIEGHGRPCVHGEHVYVTYSDGYVAALGREQGNIVWVRPLSLRGGVFVDADADPLVHAGKLFVASYSDGVYALDLRDGQTVWSRGASAVVSLARQGENIIAGNADGWVWGMSQDKGDLVFRTKLGPGPVSRMVVNDQVITLTAGPMGLVALDRRGKPLQASPLGVRTLGDPVLQENTLAFITGSGFLYVWEWRGFEPRV